MDSIETREPSYYEVALTNRQVLVAFVALLVCLLAAFLSGVWVGQDAGGRQAVAPPPPPPAGEPLEQLTFFNGREPGERSTAQPAVPAATAAPAQRETAEPEPDPAAEAMRRTLEAEMAANREPEVAAPAAAPAAAAIVAEAGSRTRQTPATTTPAPTVETARPAASTAPIAAAGTWVQVYSSTNGERAREIVASLRRAKFPVVLAQLPRDGASQYRVRVGPYPARDRAEAAAARLRREHRLDTWITDTP